MRFQTEDFTIDCTRPDRAQLIGVLRLPSPAAYEACFEPLRQGLSAAAESYTVDISQVHFLNSSGITGLSRLVLLARNAGKPLVLIGSRSASWQGKTLNLLKRLYDKLEVQLV